MLGSPRLALALLFAATVPAAAQDASFWVSIGSFKSFEAAQRLQAEAVQTLAEPVQTLAAQVAGRAVFRVVGGPYGSRAAADERARRAQTSGYPDAWVLRVQGVATAGAGIAPAAQGLTLDATPLGAEFGEDAALDLDLADLADFDEFADLASRAALDDPDALQSLAATPPARPEGSFIEPTEEPAWEAPPGFKLHRLPRPGDGAIPAPLPVDADEPSRTHGVMCKLTGWLRLVKSCRDS